MADFLLSVMSAQADMEFKIWYTLAGGVFALRMWGASYHKHM